MTQSSDPLDTIEALVKSNAKVQAPKTINPLALP